LSVVFLVSMLIVLCAASIAMRLLHASRIRRTDDAAAIASLSLIASAQADQTKAASGSQTFRFRGREAACGARQQSNAQARFELAHGMAERRLRDAQRCGGFRETALSRYGHKGQQIIAIAALHLSLPKALLHRKRLGVRRHAPAS